MTAQRLLVAIAVIVSITALVSGYGVYRESEGLKDALIEGCEQNRGPLTSYFEDELADNTGPAARNQIKKLLPDADPELLDRLLADEVRKLEAVLQAVDPATCEGQYR